MKIEIWSDFACPFCYVAKTRFENALAKFENKDEVEVVYKSFILNPNAPYETDLNAHEALAKAKGISVQQAKQLNERVGKMAAEVGLNYNYDKLQQTNTNNAHRLLQWANTLGKGSELSSKFFETFYIIGENIADTNTLLKKVEAVGLDPKKAREILEFDEYEIEVENDIREAQMLGIQGVPTFVINREFGVSGAQREEYFLQVLKDTYEKSKPNKINIQADADACGIDGCDI